MQNTKTDIRALSLALLSGILVALGAGLAQGQTASKPAAAAPGEASKPKPVADIWVIKSVFQQGGDWTQNVKPTVTSESVAQLRQIPCVSRLAARRADAIVDFRAKDGQTIQTEIWTFDSTDLNARGWVLGAPEAAPDAHHVSPSLALRLGLPQKAVVGQTLTAAKLASTFHVSESHTAAPNPAPPALAPGLVHGVKLSYGGTFNVDPKILSRPLSDLVIKFGSLFLSKDETWTKSQLWGQELNGATFYVRTKPGLGQEEREACRRNLHAHMQIWAAAMPRNHWSLVPLEE